MRIDNYAFGTITIEGTTYTKDVLLLPPRVHSPWWRKEGHRLEMADLDEVIAFAPEVLVIGTGAYGLMEVPDDTRAALGERRIEIEVLPTEQAGRRFGELIAARKKVAGAFHLTC